MKVLVLNGPNLNMLGKRPKEHYGTKTLEEINSLMKETASGFDFTFYQSNYEGDIVTKIQEAVLNGFDAIIINPAAFTHTSVAIHDALEMFNGKIIEVHLSNVDDREDFRKVNFIRSVATKTFSGKHELSYVDAVLYLKNNE